MSNAYGKEFVKIFREFLGKIFLPAVFELLQKKSDNPVVYERASCRIERSKPVSASVAIRDGNGSFNSAMFAYILVIFFPVRQAFFAKNSTRKAFPAACGTREIARKENVFKKIFYLSFTARHSRFPLSFFLIIYSEKPLHS